MVKPWNPDLGVRSAKAILIFESSLPFGGVELLIGGFNPSS